MNVLVLTFFFCLLYEASSYEEPWVDLRYVSRNFNSRDLQATTIASPTPSQCRVPGYQCYGCRQSFFCYQVNGEWFLEDVQSCPAGTSCNGGNCTVQPNTECFPQKLFTCRSTEGMYPDPSSCKTFYYCLPVNGTQTLELRASKCSAGYGYNPLTTYCDKPLNNDLCEEYSVPRCNSPGQSGPLPSNPTIFYICRPVPGAPSRTLYPYLDACQNGRKFHAANNSCV